MPRSASGNYTLPNQVNPVVGQTPILAIWANLTMPDIATALTGSLDRSGNGAMLAQLKLASGAVGAPGLGFSAEPSSGLYRAGAGDLRISIAGTDRVTFTAATLTIAATLLAGSGTMSLPGLSFSAEPASGIYRAGAGDLRIAIGGTDLLSCTTKIGISAATAATGGARQDALVLNNGDLDLHLVTAPTSTTAISNRLTKANLIKAWALITVDGTTTPFTVTVHEAFNITSVARSAAGAFTVTFASAFAGTTYGVLGQVLNGLVGADQVLVNPTTRNVGSNVLGLTLSKTGGSVNAGAIDGWGTAVQVMLIYMGAQ